MSKYKYDTSLQALVGPGVEGLRCGPFDSIAIAIALECAYVAGGTPLHGGRVRPVGRPGFSPAGGSREELVTARSLFMLRAIDEAGVLSGRRLRKVVAGNNQFYWILLGALKADGAIVPAMHGGRQAGWSVTDRGRAQLAAGQIGITFDNIAALGTEVLS
jgi:hypothetical protein